MSGLNSLVTRTAARMLESPPHHVLISSENRSIGRYGEPVEFLRQAPEFDFHSFDKYLTILRQAGV